MTDTRYAWQCDECGDDIADGEGYLSIDAGELAAAREAMAGWEQKHPHHPYRLHVVTPGRVMELPAPVQWRACHTDCDPRPEGTGYVFDVARARTDRHLLAWTLHFMDTRPWIVSTDWVDFVQTRTGALISETRSGVRCV